MSFRIDREKVQKTIALVLDKIRTEADPLLLEEYHRLFKKEVSLFHRSRAAAYMLMLCDQRKNLRFVHRSDFTRKEEDAPRYPLAEEESKRLFFSVGRSRRVFPREILGLISTKTATSREDIGSIRILDNYSFVQVRDTVAEKIIEALNGTIFRGRPLTVNYAKSRRDEENNAAENENEIYSEDETPDDNPSDN
jgi:RNA recognition motif-containing protein